MARVPYLTPNSTTGEVAEVLSKLQKRGIRMHILEAVANSKGGFRSFVRFANSLMRYTSLPGKLREIVIMRLAQRLNSPYEWRQHEAFARREGVTDDQLAHLKLGEINSGAFDDAELAIIRFADEAAVMHLTDDTFDRVRVYLGTEETVDLVLVVAWWGGMVPRIIEALKIELEDD